ncbi:MAG: PEP-CTERM sorting domain-containing protein [Desulfobacteraceae bacterium]|nr:MAG: PEP-CTERM sorting domain-containing protein [Desulfobacteraceae bacterium]
MAPPDGEPIPEPATVLLLGSDLAGLAGFRRRFRKN